MMRSSKIDLNWLLSKFDILVSLTNEMIKALSEDEVEVCALLNDKRSEILLLINKHSNFLKAYASFPRELTSENDKVLLDRIQHYSRAFKDANDQLMTLADYESKRRFNVLKNIQIMKLVQYV